ncbi:MAG: DUF1800 domain-containing protein [Pseudomonadota bacterium]
MIKTAQHIIGAAAILALAACKIPVGSDDGEGEATQASVEVEDPATQTPDPTPAPAPAPSTPPMPLPPPDDQDAVKFFSQASFGGSEDDIATLQTIGIENWILDQIDQPMYSTVDRIEEHRAVQAANANAYARLFWERALNADDQLRQRVAYALSQIVVASLSDSVIRANARSYAVYLDMLQEQALGNYCTLIKDVSINPMMGVYLTHLGNRKADETAGFVPDENYAREVMQLFTIGLENLNSDGTGQGTETYTIEDVQGLAAVFTGLSWSDTNFFFPSINDDNRFLPMEGFSAQHEEDPKSFLGTTIDLGTDAVTSVNAALDYLLAHPNVAPFISKQLIQKLVTSNPTPGYVSRVAAAFEAGIYGMPGGDQVGTGNRCDMAATVAAILLDDEARGAPLDDNFGKLRNPVLRVAQYLRAFRVDRDQLLTGVLPSAFTLDSLEDFNRLGINAYNSPSVFNDFRPGYVAPGTESADAGLVAPEFQIATSNSIVVYINTMESFIDGVPTDGVNQNAASVDFTDIDADANDPAVLVDRLSRILTGSTLSDANRTAIIDAVSLIDIAGSDQDNDRKDRREVALMMLVTSPEYMVQR